MNSRYDKTNELVNRGSIYDAWIKNRRINYSSIEGNYPLFGKKAKGCYVWDVDGNKYIDYTMGYGTILLGHANDDVNNAVIEEISKGTCLSPLWKPIQIELGFLLHEIIPNAQNVFFMKTGSDATSGAVRLARCFTGRDIVLRWGYNGWHDWSTPRPFGVPLCVQNDVKKFDYNSLSQLEDLFRKYKDRVACVIMMPFELEMPYDGFLSSVIEIAHKNGALFILDEMRSGFRMSLGGAQEYFGITPDLSTFSKAMANGYPISAITGRTEIFENINHTKMTATYFTSSYEMVAAKTTIEIVRKTEMIGYIWNIGDYFMNELKGLIDFYSIRADVVGVSPMPFIRFNYGEDNERIKRLFFGCCSDSGVLFHPNHHWYISGSHTRANIDDTLNACEFAFKKIAGD